MEPLHIGKVAAAVSLSARRQYPTRTRVSRVINDRSLELVPCDTDVTPDVFFPPTTPLTKERLKTYYEFQRAFRSYEFASFLAGTLHYLSESGAPLHFEGDAVVDIQVLNTMEFDVSDLLPNALQLHDAETSTTIPCVATHEIIHNISTLPKKTRKNLGINQIASGNDTLSNPRNVGPKHYKETAPHWWVAAIVEGSDNGLSGTRKMIHLDISAPSYDRDAFYKYDGFYVPFDVFCTPEMLIAPNPKMKRNFLLRASVKKPGVQYRQKIMLAPKLRHFRLMQKTDNSKVEVTTLEKFVERDINTAKGAEHQEALRTAMNAIAQQVWDGAVRKLKPGTLVVLRCLKARPELNGRKGRVQGNAAGELEFEGDRIPILLEQLEKPILVRTYCISFVHHRRQYRSHEELKQAVAAEDKRYTSMGPSSAMTLKERKMITRALTGPDQTISQAYDIVSSGSASIFSYADPVFREGIGKLLKPPLIKLISPEVQQPMAQMLEIAEHPSADTAFKILKIIHQEKVRVMGANPQLESAEVFEAKSSQLTHLLSSVGKKIKADKGLSEVFDRMDELGLYVNPARTPLQDIPKVTFF